MSRAHQSTEDHDESRLYEIRLKGYLDARWVDWFGNLSLAHESDGVTLLSGRLIDQAALHGVLKRVRDLGLPLVSVTLVEPVETDEPGRSTIESPGEPP